MWYKFQLYFIVNLKQHGNIVANTYFHSHFGFESHSRVFLSELLQATIHETDWVTSLYFFMYLVEAYSKCLFHEKKKPKEKKPKHLFAFPQKREWIKCLASV